MTSVKSYFDTHSHNHAYQKEPKFYDDLAKHLIKNQGTKKLKVLDVGCGGGAFIKSMIDVGIDADFVGVDVSESMVNTAKDTLSKYQDRVKIILIDGFDIATKLDSKFDVIHMDSILHHLIAATQGQSMKLVKKMLDLLATLLENNGLMIVEEVYYNSYLYPKLTSKLIFYGLKILNALKLDVHKWVPDVQLGLEVNFMHEEELERLLSKYGKNIFMFKKTSVIVPRMYMYLMLKNYGRVSFIVGR